MRSSCGNNFQNPGTASGAGNGPGSRGETVERARNGRQIFGQKAYRFIFKTTVMAMAVRAEKAAQMNR
jgi:hypothetical protein